MSTAAHNLEVGTSVSGEIKRFHVSAEPAKITTALMREGAVIVEQLLDRETVDHINAELDPVLTTDHHGVKDDQVVGQSRRLNAILRHSPTTVNRVANHPVLIGQAEAVLGDHTDTLQLNLFASEVTPGEQSQQFHRDDWNWGHVKGRSHPLCVFSIVALSEFTVTNGATRFIPDSNLWRDAYDTADDKSKWRNGVYEHKSLPRGQFEGLAVSATMDAGSVVIALGSTLHGAGVNQTADVFRRALQVKYCMGWLRTTANNFLLYPPEFAKTLPEEVQRLLGYQLEAKHLGMLEQSVDPIELLRN